MRPALVNVAVVVLALFMTAFGVFAAKMFSDMFSHELMMPSVTCMEDQPCWDCSSMGNLICGAR